MCTNEQVGLVQGRLYVPHTWIDDPERCRKAGIPTDQQLYRTKPELAIEIRKTLPKEMVYDWVGGDCIYGNSLTLRQYLYDEKQAFILDVGEELGVYLTKPHVYIPAKKGIKGPNPTAFVCDDKPISLKNLIKEIPEQNWKTITHRKGTKGDLVRKATILAVHIWKPERKETSESVQLLISTEADGSEIKYSLCYTHESKIELETALYRQMQRYWIERAFQNAKQQLGLHQYQVRSWNAWYHHIALTLMALHFLLEVQQEHKEDLPLLSVPDIKLIFAKKLMNNLNSDKGIMEALFIRHLKRKKDIDRYFKAPK